TRITRKGELHLGARRQSPPIAMGGLSGTDLFRTTFVPLIEPYKYTKLMYNAAISPVAAAAGIDNGQLLSVPAARRLFFALLRENYEILAGAGVRLARIGPFHPRSVQRILRYRVVANALALVIYPSLRGSYCSMYADLPRG